MRGQDRGELPLFEVQPPAPVAPIDLHVAEERDAHLALAARAEAGHGHGAARLVNALLLLLFCELGFRSGWSRSERVELASVQPDGAAGGAVVEEHPACSPLLHGTPAADAVHAPDSTNVAPAAYAWGATSHSVPLSTTDRKALKARADAELRSMSNYVATLILEELR